MKIYLSKYWRQNSLFILCLMILLIGALVFFCIWSNDREDYIMVLCAAWCVFILGCILVCSKRFLTYAIVEKHEIHSYSFFSKKLCTKRFIVLSNEPFEYQATYGAAKVRFIQHYNMAKQMVLPYNEQTIPILNLDAWQKMN